MSNNKQSSVEWLQLVLVDTILTHEQVMQTIGLFEQAKEMHMNEICDAHYEGQKSDRLSFTWDDHPEYWSCEYYLDTFERKNK